MTNPFLRASAYMKGQGPQYERAQLEREAFNLEKQELHKKALAEDVRAMNIMAYGGPNGEQGSADLQGIAGILESRVNTLRQQGGDATESLATLNMIRSGDPQQIGNALADLAQADQIAVANGFLPPMFQNQQDKLNKVEGGQGIYQRPDGSLYSRPVEGYADTGNAKDMQALIGKHRDAIKDITKDMRLVDVSYSKMKNSAKRKTAAGDMSLIFGIMKMNDPGSTVREGEYATAQDAGSLNQRFVSYYNSAWNGQKLSQEQRDDFVAQAEALYNAQRQNTDIQIDNILQQADQDGLDRVRLFGPDRYKEFEKRMEGYRNRGDGDIPQPGQKPVVIEFGDLPDA